MSQFDIKESANIRTSGFGSVATMGMAIVSVGLNLVLVTKLFHQHPSLPPAPSQSGGNNMGNLAKAISSRSVTNAAPSSLAKNAAAFHWSEIEYTDYRQYIANLRAVGCPEQVIRDIIQADVNQLFAARVQAIWKPHPTAYWQTDNHDSAGPYQLKQLMKIDREKNGVLQALLGFKSSQQALMDTLYLQLQGSEYELLFLSPERRELALKSLTDAEFEIREIEFQNRNRYTAADEQKLFAEKTALLASVLSPEEMEEFKLRNSPTAQTLRTELEYFDCTLEEFKQLFTAREQKVDGKNYGPDSPNPTTSEKVREILGDERAKEFERVTDLLYLTIRRTAGEQGVTLDKIEQAWQITRDARTRADLVAKNSGLTDAERKGQVQALQQEADAHLIELLGDKGSLTGRHELSTLLGVTEVNIGK
jgi:hypothetical protein